MTATASILTTEIIRRPDGVAIRAENSVKEYENYHWAKEALDESLFLWLTTLQNREYKLEATRGSFKLQIADDRDARRTRHVEVQIVLNV